MIKKTLINLGLRIVLILCNIKRNQLEVPLVRPIRNCEITPDNAYTSLLPLSVLIFLYSKMVSAIIKISISVKAKSIME